MAVAATLAMFASGASATVHETSLAEMYHTTWTARDGAPQGVRALAQTPDGILWLGTEGGLFRFDGNGFTEFRSPPGEPDLPAGAVYSLLTAHDGSVWAGYYQGGVVHIDHGHPSIFRQADGKPISYVEHLRQASDGTLYALTGQRFLMRFGREQQWHLEPLPLGEADTPTFDVFVDSSDTLWLAQKGHLYRRPLTDTHYSDTGVEADWIFGFVEAPDHSLWITDVITEIDRGRTQHVDRLGHLLGRLPNEAEAYALLMTPDGSLVMAQQFHGLRRFPASTLSASRKVDTLPVGESYARLDGLSSDTQYALLEDMDGNVWSGGKRGLDRFRQALLTPFLSRRTEGGLGLCASPQGEVWIASEANQLYRVSHGTTQSFPQAGDFSSISCGDAGTAWLTDHAGIWEAGPTGLKPVASISGVGPYDLHRVVANSQRVLYASVIGPQRGIWRLQDGHWNKLPDIGLPGSTFIEYVDSQDRLWAGYRDGVISLPLEGRIFRSGDPGLGIVYSFLEIPRGLLVGGMNGVAIAGTSGLRMLALKDRTLARGVAGMVESLNGDLWLNTSRGIVHIARTELNSALDEPSHLMESQLITEGEFAGSLQLFGHMATTGRDAEGNLWFATLNGVMHLDPEHLTADSHPPILAIRGFAIDGRPPDTTGRIPPRPQTLNVQYLGVNLTAPDKVVYRYRLDGLDDEWQYAGRRTEAIYTRLKAGTYTFRVSASNGDGNWTAPISSATFVVLSSFYETTWFYALSMAAVLVLTWTIYQLRLRHLQRRHEAQNQARLGLAHVTRLATLSTMTASITHEVSQPISGILTNANTCARMLAADPPNVAGAAETVRRSIRDANRANEVIKRLRAMFAKRESTMESIDLNDAAREVIALSSAELQWSGSVLQTDFAETLPAISGDRIQLQQVILNLLLNAADAMAGIDDRPRTLRVQTEIQGNSAVKLLVQDSGVGLDPRGIEKLFEAFYTTKTHGLGIGLAVSRSITRVTRESSGLPPTTDRAQPSASPSLALPAP